MVRLSFAGKNRFAVLFMILATMASSWSCAQSTNLRETVTLSAKVTTTSSPIDVKGLCARLGEMKDMPYHPGQRNDDPIYNGLMDAGASAIPCLIEKIVDTTPMQDPNKSPSVSGFVVGDAATFMLLYITRVPWQPESMFPPSVAKTWTSRGIFAYYAYTEKPANRRAFQQWWKDWYKTKQIEKKQK